MSSHSMDDDLNPKAAEVSSNLVRSGVFTFIAQVLITLCNILSGVILARKLGVAGRGDYAAAIIYLQPVSFIAAMGIVHANIYYVGKDHSNVYPAFFNSLISALISSVPILILMEYLLPLLLKAQNKSIISLAQISMLILPIAVFRGNIIALLPALQRFNLFNLHAILNRFAHLGCLLVFALFFSLSVEKAVFSLIVPPLLVSSAFLFIVFHKLRILSFRADIDLLKKTWRYGCQVQFGVAIGWINQRLSNMVIANKLSGEPLGLYAIATSVSALLQQFHVPFGLMLMPIVSSYSITDAIKFICKSFRIGLIVFCSAAFVLLITGRFFIWMLYGKDFIPAVLPMRILVVGYIFIGLIQILEGGIQGMGFPIMTVYGRAGALVSMISLLSILVPKMGIIGAAYAFSAAYAVNLLIILLIFCWKTKVGVEKLICFEKADILFLVNTVTSKILRRR